MNDKIPQTIRQVLRAAPAAALATGIVCPAALADPGDLDPTFADVGRFTPPDLRGRAQSLVTQEDNYVFAGGGLEFDFFTYETDTLGFADRLSVDGILDAGFNAPDLADTLVVDTATQPDNKIVGVGRRHDVYIVFRLELDGALDAGFGVAGVRELTDVTGLGSIAVDPAGTIIVAGTQGADLKVLRMLANGDLDDSFGTAGVFTAPADTADEQIQTLPRVVSMLGSGYRVTDNDFGASGKARCRVLALTADGTVDETFGDHGYAGLVSTNDGIACDAMIESPDGGLLVSGADGVKPVLVKLIASGAPDPAFAVDELSSTSMIEAAAIGIDANTGAIAVAGYGPQDVAGFPVARLQSNGSLDPLFGSGGVTWVDLPPGRPHPFVSDLAVLANSDVLIAGGSDFNFFASTPFITRLVGGDDKDSPGVIGVLNHPSIEASEDGQQAIVTVRRVGGKAGSVSVAYATRAASSDAFHATEGDDFTALTERLTWAEGDAADKQIIVPIAPDDGAPEEQEDFDVELSDVQGGAGLGTSITTVSIASDATDAGMFAIESEGLQVSEQDLTVQVYITRSYSWSGAVSVTVGPASDTATAGDDFVPDPLTVSWADGDSEGKFVDIPIVNDSARESSERFTLQLSDPTGGAVVGPRSTASVTILDDEPAPPPPPPTGGGGGHIGIGSLLWLGFLRWLRVGSGRR